MAGKKVMIEVRKLCKNFGITVALNHVSFCAYGGEICGLIGENGSGKSTATSIIAGMQPATSGEMFYKGEPWKPATMLEAQEKGIGMIVQEAGTLANVSVAENIFMGHEKMFRAGPFISKKKMVHAAGELLASLEINISPEIITGRLNSEERKLIEIARAMYWKPDVFVVDETTTALSHNGRELLYKLMHQLAEAGKCVIFISHDLGELVEQCMRLVILRDGIIVGELDKEAFDDETIKKMMVGRELKGDYYYADEEGYSDEIVLEADCITTMQDILCFDLKLHKGEILGLGGLSECGMHTVGRALFGLDKVLDGQVTIANGIRIENSRAAIDSGMAYLSKNRDVESLGLSGTIHENISSTGYKLNHMLGPLISPGKEKAYVNRQVEALSIKCAGVQYPVNTLSGGNKQKVVFGKWMAAKADIFILDCPTRGVDVGVKASMYRLMYELKKAGKSIILISEELQELMGMSDRILVMKDGEVSCERLRSEGFSEFELIKYMI